MTLDCLVLEIIQTCLVGSYEQLKYCIYNNYIYIIQNNNLTIYREIFMQRYTSKNKRTKIKYIRYGLQTRVVDIHTIHAVFSTSAQHQI